MLLNYQSRSGILPAVGRPRLPADRRRTKTAGVRFTAAEWARIERRATVAGQRPTAWVRSAVLSALSSSPAVSRSPTPATVEERRELRRIGANLNQVARRLNAGRDADVLAAVDELNAWIVERVSRPR